MTRIYPLCMTGGCWLGDLTTWSVDGILVLSEDCEGEAKVITELATDMNSPRTD